MIDMCPIFTAPEYWYIDMIHYLQQGYLPEHWNSKQRRALCLKSASYQIIDGFLFRKNYEGVVDTIFEIFNYGRCGGNRPYWKSIGKAFSKFVWVLKAFLEWNSASETTDSRNEVKDSVNRWPRFEMINIDGRKGISQIRDSR